jgi:hypothetical protein
MLIIFKGKIQDKFVTLRILFVSTPEAFAAMLIPNCTAGKWNNVKFTFIAFVEVLKLNIIFASVLFTNRYTFISQVWIIISTIVDAQVDYAHKAIQFLKSAFDRKQ